MSWINWLSSQKDIAPILASFAAIFAVLITPLVQIYVTKRQQKAAVVSSSRAKWIADLRSDLSEYIELIYHTSAIQYESEQMFLKERQARQREDDKEADRLRDLGLKLQLENSEKPMRANALHNSLRIRLNPADALQKKLLAEIEKMDVLASRAWHSYPPDSSERIRAEFDVVVGPLIGHARTLLAVEWQKVERLV